MVVSRGSSLKNDAWCKQKIIKLEFYCISISTSLPIRIISIPPLGLSDTLNSPFSIFLHSFSTTLVDLMLCPNYLKPRFITISRNSIVVVLHILVCHFFCSSAFLLVLGLLLSYLLPGNSMLTVPNFEILHPLP